jgi:hypothetical protein
LDLSTIANLATALAVLIAVIFGLIEMRRARRDREERAAFAAVQAILTPEWMRSMIRVHNIPDGANASMIESDARLLDAVSAVGIILEGLGYSVYARIVPLHVVGDLMGGTVRLAWRKLQPYIEEERQRSGSRKFFEWFEWLATQVERHPPGETNLQIGAQEAYGDLETLRAAARLRFGRQIAAHSPVAIDLKDLVAAGLRENYELHK